MKILVFELREGGGMFAVITEYGEDAVQAEWRVKREYRKRYGKELRLARSMPALTGAELFDALDVWEAQNQPHHSDLYMEPGWSSICKGCGITVLLSNLGVTDTTGTLCGTCAISRYDTKGQS